MVIKGPSVFKHACLGVYVLHPDAKLWPLASACVIEMNGLFDLMQELEAIKARVREMEEESAKLKQLQSEVDRQLSSGSGASASLNLSFEEKLEIDSKWASFPTLKLDVELIS